MSASSTMTYKKWEKKVRETIAEDWLDLIDSSISLGTHLKWILLTLHARYKPQKDGSWSASPRWQDMFNWTSCHMDKVRAVILLKGPKTVSGRVSDYRSTGYGAGVQRKSDSTDGQCISDIGTVWSMLEVAQKCLQYPDADLKALMEGKYRKGFNPECLSQRGILFLNVALTAGHSAQKDTESSHVELWQFFTLGLLNEMSGRNIPLFHWYTTKIIMCQMDDWEHDGKFMISKPNDLDLTYYASHEDCRQHICYLKPYQINNYAKELKDKKFRKHKAILAEIYQSMVCESKVQTYPATMEVRHSIKRRADLGFEDMQKKTIKKKRQFLE